MVRLDASSSPASYYVVVPVQKRKALDVSDFWGEDDGNRRD